MLNKNKWLFSLSATCLVLAVIVLNKKQTLGIPQDFVIPKAKQLNHPNGLKLLIPQGHVAKQQASGFAIEPEINKSRYPVYIYVTMVDGDEYRKHKPFQTIEIAGKTIHYREKFDGNQGASGNPAYSVLAYEITKQGYIQYKQSTQSENGAPAFGSLWLIIANAKSG